MHVDIDTNQWCECSWLVSLRACLHEGGGPQISEVTCGESPNLSCKCVPLKLEIIWTGRLPHLSGLPHLPGVLHTHVNRP